MKRKNGEEEEVEIEKKSKVLLEHLCGLIVENKPEEAMSLAVEYRESVELAKRKIQEAEAAEKKQQEEWETEYKRKEDKEKADDKLKLSKTNLTKIFSHVFRGRYDEAKQMIPLNTRHLPHASTNPPGRHFYFCPLLHYAIAGGHFDIADYLLEG